jgi:hypothetical protein
MPSRDAIGLRSNRFYVVIQNVVNATQLQLPEHNIQLYGWKINGTQVEPIWDSDKSLKSIRMVIGDALSKCACKVSGCNPEKKQCNCVRGGRECTTLCKCHNCMNSSSSDTQEADLAEESTTDTDNNDDDNEDDSLSDQSVDDTQCGGYSDSSSVLDSSDDSVIV